MIYTTRKALVHKWSTFNVNNLTRGGSSRVKGKTLESDLCIRCWKKKQTNKRIHLYRIPVVVGVVVPLTYILVPSLLCGLYYSSIYISLSSLPFKTNKTAHLIG